MEAPCRGRAIGWSVLPGSLALARHSEPGRAGYERSKRHGPYPVRGHHAEHHAGLVAAVLARRLADAGLGARGRPSAPDIALHPLFIPRPGGRIAFGRQPAEGGPGKWIEVRPVVLLLDEPTRGVDVGAKHEIYELMNQWTSQGIAILLITSEMPELLAMSDRIIVLHRGRLAADFSRKEATQERILRAAMGEGGSG